MTKRKARDCQSHTPALDIVTMPIVWDHLTATENERQGKQSSHSEGTHNAPVGSAHRQSTGRVARIAAAVEGGRSRRRRESARVARGNRRKTASPGTPSAQGARCRPLCGPVPKEGVLCALASFAKDLSCCVVLLRSLHFRRQSRGGSLDFHSFVSSPLCCL